MLRKNSINEEIVLFTIAGVAVTLEAVIAVILVVAFFITMCTTCSNIQDKNKINAKVSSENSAIDLQQALEKEPESFIPARDTTQYNGN